MKYIINLLLMGLCLAFSNAFSLEIDELEINDCTEIQLGKLYIHNLESWKDGKISTIDGWGRHSILDINKKNKVKLIPISREHGMKIDGVAQSIPEMSVLFTESYFGHFYHFADFEKNKKITLNTNYHPTDIEVIDMENKHFLITFKSEYNSISQSFGEIIYDLKNEKIIYDSEKENAETKFKDKFIHCYLRNGFFLCEEFTPNVDRRTYNYCIFDYYNNKSTYTDLTEFFSQNEILNYLKIKNQDKFIVSTNKRNDRIITCSENYKIECTRNVIQEPIEWKNKKFQSRIVSPDSKWIVGAVGNYPITVEDSSSLDGKKTINRKKFCFVNIDEKSPYCGIPVVTGDMFRNNPKGQFYDHPVYGPCFVEHIKNEMENYLLIYKMSDIEKILHRYTSKE